MLAQALKVVEAARALGLNPGSAGLYSITCEPRQFHQRLRELAESIEGFDRATGHGTDAKAVLGRALRYVSARGIDVRAMMAAITPPEEGLEATAEAELRPQPGEVGAPDRLQDVSVSRQASRDGDPALGIEPELAPRFEIDDDFPGAGAGIPDPIAAEDEPLDPMELPEPPPPRLNPPPPADEKREASPDEMVVMKEVEERLEAMANLIGWTPKLQEVDAAWRKARDSMDQVPTPDGSFAYLMTAESVAELERVIAELAELEMGAELDEDFEAAVARALDLR